jgi:signal transduction histidine kinase/ligand-binding sensor domain-containing protein
MLFHPADTKSRLGLLRPAKALNRIMRSMIWLGVLAAVVCCSARAAQPDRTIAQYAHTAWGSKDGAPADITALAQTTDGYLWLASPDGLIRFDGVVFERYQSQSGDPFPAFNAHSLLALPNGDLWIGFSSGEISLLRSGKVTTYSTGEGVLRRAPVLGFAQDRKGTIWAATGRGLERLEDNRWKQVGRDWNYPADLATAIFLDRQGTLWVSTGDELVFLPAGARKFQQPHTRVRGASGIDQAANGKLWMAETSRSVHPVPLSDKQLPADDTEIIAGSMAILIDRNDGLWITTMDAGLHHAPAPESFHGKIPAPGNAIESFTAADGLSDNFVRSIFQDREGNIWVGTNGGLDRFRKTSLVPVSLPSDFDYAHAILVAGDADGGRVESLGDLARLHEGRVAFEHRLPDNCSAMSAYHDSADTITWMCDDAIFRYHAGSYTRIPFPPSFPKLFLEEALAITGDDSGAIWLAVRAKGMFYWNEGRWQRLKTTPEFDELTPKTALTDWMGRAWIGYGDGSVAIVEGGNIRKIYSYEDSPVGAISKISMRGRHIWEGGRNGVAFFDGDRFRRIVPEDEKQIGSVIDVEETTDGSLWLGEQNGALQIPAIEVQRALENPSYRVKCRLFNSFDGLPGRFVGTQTTQREIQGTDGRLWFVTSGGVAWVDPAHLITNTLPPPVSIRSVKANDRQAGPLTDLTLPPRTTNLQISYTALSLIVPERVRFRYMLETVDKEWQDADTRREAFYNNLGPGSYHFRVIACNNDGVWNQAGARLDFRIAPAWFQTRWFEALCVGLFLLLLWALYQLRLRQLEQQFNATLQTRVDERTRIARELHDTLLQSFQGAAFQFQAARKLLLRNADGAMDVVDEAIHSAEEGITEGRAAIRDLRPEPAAQRNLPELLQTTSRELAAAQELNGHAPSYQVLVEGEQQDLSPMLQSEVYRICREVIRNAFAHAVASHIEVEIRYDQDQLRVRIRDDGKGIDPKILAAGGQPGHWGISGMRERARRIGSRLDFWSEVGAGTEVQLTVPAAMAYEKRRHNRRFRLFRSAASDE